MSKPASPTAIGGFTLGAIALLVASILLFGGRQLFNRDIMRYVVFFDSSLNGLEVGAPVKMQGVKIGAVTSISLMVDSTTSRVYKPVVIEIDRTTMTSPGGVPLPRNPGHEQQLATRDRLVSSGFRARLETQSLLTGLLFVDFDRHPNRSAQFANVDFQGLIELPGLPTTTDDIRNTIEELARSLRNLPLEQMVHNLAGTLAEVRKIVGSEEMKRSNAALANTLEKMDANLTTLNQHLGPLLQETNKAVGDTRSLVQDSRNLVKDFQGSIKPVLASTEKTLNSASSALEKAQSTLNTVDGALGPNSSLNQTLTALRNTSRSIKDLTDFLERHPESLLSGKTP